MRRRRIRFPLLPLAAASVLLLWGCNPIPTGIWEISGTDAQLGPFQGTLEVRTGPEGGMEAIRLVELHDRTYPDGRTIELAWTGRVERALDEPWVLAFSLRRADFITEVGSVVRTEADRDPLPVRAWVRSAEADGLSLTYASSEDPDFHVEEVGVRAGEPGPEPIFRSERTVHATHPKPDPLIKALLFDLFETYHALPAVEPYVDHPAFQDAVHYQVVERTDFDYYRAHPDRIRVVNKVADAIGLEETAIRANAFRARFHEKASHYQAELTDRFVQPHGMVTGGLDLAGNEHPDYDGALWTGMYTYTQALRYRLTGEAEALEDVRRTLAAILTLMDITEDPRSFARTLRLASDPLPGGWHHGSGAFAHLDWREPGNNDMAKGLLMGMLAGWEVLPEGDPVRVQIPPHALGLIDLCEFMAEPAPECSATGSGLGLPSINPGAAYLMAGVTNDAPDLIALGLAWLRDPLLVAYAEVMGGGPIHVFGISDWSGNHLTLASTLALQWLLDRSGDAELAGIWRDASGRAWQILKTMDFPLHATLAVGVGALADPAEQEEAETMALWGLRTYPFPKHPYPVDHRIRGDFVLSPFPALPWKEDWVTNPGRQASLVAYGILESVGEKYWWKDNPFSIRGGGLGDEAVPGVDFLVIYWLARTHGLIGPED